MCCTFPICLSACWSCHSPYPQTLATPSSTPLTQASNCLPLYVILIITLSMLSVKCNVYVYPCPTPPHSANSCFLDFYFFFVYACFCCLLLLFSVVVLTSVCSPCVSFCFYSRSLRARLFIACLACRCDVKSSSSSPLSSALLWCFDISPLTPSPPFV